MYGFLLLILAVVVVLAQPVCWWRGSVARKRALATFKAMAQEDRNEIGGHRVEYWLDLLNREAEWPVVEVLSAVLTFRGHDFFFIDGAILYAVGDTCRWQPRVDQAIFLVAVGRSAVTILADEENVFRHMAGSDDLAVFSVYRWTSFARMLKAERGQ